MKRANAGPEEALERGPNRTQEDQADLDADPAASPRIELRQLRYFLAVAEELNFTRAAEKMGIAQPPLSQQIATLEHQLRVTLFRRTNREVVLTNEGRALALHARRVINTTAKAAAVVRAISKGEQGPLSIGAVFSSIYTLIPHILPRLSKEYPGIKVSLQEMTISQQITALLDENIDAGILRGPISSPELDFVTLFSEPFVAVVPSTTSIAEEKVVRLEQIADQPLIRVRASANRDYSRQMFSVLQDRGFNLNIVQEVSDTHTLIGLVAAGVGCSIVPASFRNIQIRQVRYIPFVDRTPQTTIDLVWRKDNNSPILKNFLMLIKVAMAETPPEAFYTVG
jgi:DNA-binding transcriptional LysR family regulator